MISTKQCSVTVMSPGDSVRLPIRGSEQASTVSPRKVKTGLHVVCAAASLVSIVHGVHD